jgi:hypothetical protein
MNDEQYSYRRADMGNTMTATHFQADPAALVGQIKSLVADPDAVALIPGRSPLFQVAMHLNVPNLPEFSRPASVITQEIFAHVRKEALKAQNKKKLLRA